MTMHKIKGLLDEGDEIVPRFLQAAVRSMKTSGLELTRWKVQRILEALAELDTVIKNLPNGG